MGVFHWYDVHPIKVECFFVLKFHFPYVGICTLAVILFGPGYLFISKMPMCQRAEMREEGLPLPPAFQYLILMI